MAAKTRTLSFRIEAAPHKWLTEIANKNGVSPSKVAQTLFSVIYKNEMRYRYNQPSIYDKEQVNGNE